MGCTACNEKTECGSSERHSMVLLMFGLLGSRPGLCSCSDFTPTCCSFLTSGAIGDHGYREVDLIGVHVRGGADRVVAGLQQGKLRQEESGWHLHRRKLFQHFNQRGVFGPFPFLVLLQTLDKRKVRQMDGGSDLPSI